MNRNPQPVKDYLAKLDENPRAEGYLCLNHNNELINSDGRLGSIYLAELDYAKSPLLLIPELEGLIPCQSHANTVIYNVAIDNNHYVDIHMFHEDTLCLLIFIDKTQSGKRLQKEQQIRLDDDIAKDKRKTGS